VHLGEIEHIPPLVFKQAALMAVWATGIN